MKAFLAALLLATLLPAAPAKAEVPPGKEGNLAEFVPPVSSQRVCFARAYSASHLARHPKQTVSAIRFYLAYIRHDPDEIRKDGQRNYYFRLEVRYRDRPDKRFTTGGDCFPGNGVIHCRVECDGGGIEVRWRKKPETILVDVSATGGIRLHECGEGEDEQGSTLKPGADDRTFLLERVRGEASCPIYDKW